MFHANCLPGRNLYEMSIPIFWKNKKKKKQKKSKHQFVVFFLFFFFMTYRNPVSLRNSRSLFGFVCVEVLRPSQPNGVMSSAVSLPNHTFTGQAYFSKRLTSIVHILSPETDNCPSWISGRERMTVENISWSISTKECCRPRRGLNPRPPGLQSDGASNWATEAGKAYLVVSSTSYQQIFVTCTSRTYQKSERESEREREVLWVSLLRYSINNVDRTIMAYFAYRHLLNRFRQKKTTNKKKKKKNNN